ncbi:hypothetical protein [Streptomyces sp. NPDC058371]|uniref:hypothetical protein n=1 Tax=Streptomyces sp. NPDC058371 TaxID=3346463 RepID=UPI00364DD955
MTSARHAGVRQQQVSLRSTGTLPRRVPSEGLRALNAELPPFGASLTRPVLDDGDWTFETLLTLRPSEGGWSCRSSGD